MSFEIETFNRVEIYLAGHLAGGYDARASVKGEKLELVRFVRAARDNIEIMSYRFGLAEASEGARDVSSRGKNER